MDYVVDRVALNRVAIPDYHIIRRLVLQEVRVALDLQTMNASVSERSEKAGNSGSASLLFASVKTKFRSPVTELFEPDFM